MATNRNEDVLAAFNGLRDSLVRSFQSLIDAVNATPGDGMTGPQTEALLTNMEAARTWAESFPVHGPLPTFPTQVPVR